MMMLLTACIVSWNHAGKASAISSGAESVQDGGGAFEPTVWIGDSLGIRWWKRDADNSYHVFLPGAVKGRKLNVTYGGADSIFVDGKKMKNGKGYVLSAGQHTLRMEGAEGAGQDLHVWYTSDIPVLFVETESGSTEQIHASKDVSEPGRMMIMDGRGRNYFGIWKASTAAAIPRLRIQKRSHT